MTQQLPGAGSPRPTVLVVEDDPVLRGLVVTLLAEAGYRTVSIAEHGRIAAAVERWKPSCVLLDGELDSAGARRSWADALAIRADHPSLPVLLFTGDREVIDEARTGTSERSRAAAFAGVVRKPFAIEELLATLANVVDTPHPASAREAAALMAPAAVQVEAEWGADLFATAFHELRSPLTTIGGQIQRARRLMPLDQERAGEALDRALAQVGRMNRLMTDVLDHARLETNALTLTLTTLDLGALIAETIGQYDHARTSRVRYDRPATPVEVHGDADRLQQILANLLDNALKYSAPETAVEVWLRIVGEEAQVRIADHGVGVAEGERDRLFTPYYRSSRTTGVRGTGLGLNISRRLAERHGGRLWLETTGDTGSVFALTLRLVRPDSISL
ncbi:MAG TPA: ATP-binding protein [Candidatus Limnocylindria bacterium]|nr:ATP-binding protein [Candidatus Limnocylindria bacterium]